MTNYMKLIIIISALFLAAWGDDFPEDPITIIVPAAVGGVSDTIAKNIAAEASQLLGVEVTVKNIPGVSNAAGLNRAFREDPDGYTLVLAPTEVVTLPLMGRVEWKTNDFTPIAGVIHMPAALMVRKDSSLDNISAIVAKSETPDGINIGSSSMSGVWYQAATAFTDSVKAKLTLKQFSDSLKIYNALTTGAVDAIIAGYTTQLPDNVKVLCIMSDTEILDVPRCKDYGVNISAGTWWMLMAPPETQEELDPEEIAVLYDTFSEVLTSGRFQTFLVSNGLVPELIRPHRLGDFLNKQASFFTPLLKENYLLD
ncbi:MAG: hypothetical protein LBV09_04775 [Deferribacteraceae bacterium]|jgi:tripartite-type tricarboxylate transporter receptor subunit TctC|nr:hypothetical protein [Deferribacteraceae bacterium]